MKNEASQQMEDVEKSEWCRPEAEATDSTTLAKEEERTLRNRRNAAHSTGPRTPAGKERSRWNSLRHGMLVRTLVAGLDPNGDDAKNYALFHEALHAEVKPVGVLEHLHLERAAAAYYRLHRGAQFEAQIVKHRDTFGWDGVDRLNRYVVAANRELSTALHELERLQRQRAGQNIPAPVLVDINVNATASEPAPGSEGTNSASLAGETAALALPSVPNSETLDAGDVADAELSSEPEWLDTGEASAADAEVEGFAPKSTDYRTKPESLEEPEAPSTLVTARIPVVGIES